MRSSNKEEEKQNMILVSSFSALQFFRIIFYSYEASSMDSLSKMFVAMFLLYKVHGNERVID